MPKLRKFFTEIVTALAGNILEGAAAAPASLKSGSSAAMKNPVMFLADMVDGGHGWC